MANLRALIGPEAPPPGDASPDWLIVMLHGVGQDGSDLLCYAPLFHAVLPGAHIASPHAPQRFDLGRTGRQWFSLQSLGPNTRLEGVQAAAPVVERFISERIAKTRVAEDRIVLCGFSQGAMVALYVGLRRKTPPAAILCHSGMVVEEPLVVSEGGSPPAVLLTHGSDDSVISPAQLSRTEALLREASVDVEAHLMSDLGHVVNEDVIAVSQDFLMRTLISRTVAPQED